MRALRYALLTQEFQSLWRGASSRNVAEATETAGKKAPNYTEDCGDMLVQKIAGDDGIKGARAKQPYAIDMKDGSPFGLAGLWENWRNPNTGEWQRTFAIITVPSNSLVGQIHHRMPAILQPGTYERWLGSAPDPYDLLITYPSEPMTMWPISMRVNAPENDDPSLLDRTMDQSDWQSPLTTIPDEKRSMR